MFEKLRDLLGAGSSIATDMQALKAEIEKKRQRRDYLMTAPLCKSDLMELVERRFNEAQDGYKLTLQAAIAPLTKPGNTESRYANRGLPLLSAAPPNMTATVALLEQSILALFGAELKPAIGKILDGMDWSRSGPPMKQREKELQSLDAEIQAIEQQIANIRAQINQARQVLDV